MSIINFKNLNYLISFLFKKKNLNIISVCFFLFETKMNGSKACYFSSHFCLKILAKLSKGEKLYEMTFLFLLQIANMFYLKNFVFFLNIKLLFYDYKLSIIFN